MKKLLIFGLLLITLGFLMGKDIGAGDLELWRLREMFKAKLNPDPTYFSDQTIDQINMKSAQIVSIHAFCCSQIDTIVLQSDQIDYSIPQHSLWNYAIKPLVSSGSDERAWQSINIQDVGKEWTLDAPTPNFFYNWTDDILGVYPTSSVADSILLYYFAYIPTSASIIDSVVSTITNCRSVAVDGNDNIYVGCYVAGSGTPQIAKSNDSTATWDTVYSGVGAIIREIFAASNNYIYAGVKNATAHTSFLIRSTDGGASWDTCITFADDSSQVWRIDEDTLGNLFLGEYSLTVQDLHRAVVWKSTDDGASWDTSYYDSDLLHCHALGVDPYTNYVYVAIDHGFYRDSCVFLRSTDGGSSWDTIGQGDQGKYTAIEFSANYRILGDDYTTTGRSDIFITADDDSANFDSVYSFPLGIITEIRKIGDVYYAGVGLTSTASTARLCLLVSYDEGQHWSVAKKYDFGPDADILEIGQYAIDDWVYYTWYNQDYVAGQLKKFRQTVQSRDLDNKCRDAILTLSTMQYWIANKRTDKAVQYWNLASQQMQTLRQGFLQRAYDIIVTTKIRENK